MDTENEHYVELWMKQSQLFWQIVYQVPVIAGAMFAGWFALKSASQDTLAQWLLVIGMLSMVVQVLILKRMAQYLNTFRQTADLLIPSVPPAFLGLSGYILGTIIPILIAIFFMALLIWSPKFNATLQQPVSPTTNNAAKIQATPLATSSLAPSSTPSSMPNPSFKRDCAKSAAP